MADPIPLSPDFIATATAEREQLLERWRSYCEQHRHHTKLADDAARHAERCAHAIRELGEIIGAEDQLSMIHLSSELRGQRLRDVAAEVIWRNFKPGDVVHYKQWLELVVRDGHRVGGKNPTATFLTQVARVNTVERVGKRSGLYRLRVAA